MKTTLVAVSKTIGITTGIPLPRDSHCATFGAAHLAREITEFPQNNPTHPTQHQMQKKLELSETTVLK